MTNFYNAGVGPESMLIARRSHNHTVHIYIRRSSDGRGVVVTRIERSKGRVPDIDGIVGAVFHSPKAIRRAVLYRMQKAIDNADDGGIHDD